MKSTPAASICPRAAKQDPAPPREKRSTDQTTRASNLLDRASATRAGAWRRRLLVPLHDGVAAVAAEALDGRPLVGGRLLEGADAHVGGNALDHGRRLLQNVLQRHHEQGRRAELPRPNRPEGRSPPRGRP